MPGNNNQWIKVLFYIGVFHIASILIILLLVITGIKQIAVYEDHVLRGLGYYSIYVFGLTIIYYVITKRVSPRIEFLADTRTGMVLGVIGSLLVVVPYSYMLFFGFPREPGFEILLNNAVFIGVALSILCLVSWLKNYDEPVLSGHVFLGLIFPVASIALYDLLQYMYMATFNPSLLVFGSQVFVGGLILSLITLLMGLETILERQESYLAGSVYTVAILLIALYIVQALTLYTTTSILADNIKGLVSMPQYISLEICDELGLLIISYKLFVGLIVLMYFLNMFAVLFIMRKKPVLPKIYE